MRPRSCCTRRRARRAPGPVTIWRRSSTPGPASRCATAPRAGTPGATIRCPRCARRGFPPTGRCCGAPRRGGRARGGGGGARGRPRALARSRLGRRAEAAGPLGELIERSPRDEEVLAELLRCEAVTVGPAAALARYADYQQRLRDELGSDPGPALQSVYQELLQADAPGNRLGVRHEANSLP